MCIADCSLQFDYTMYKYIVKDFVQNPTKSQYSWVFHWKFIR